MTDSAGVTVVSNPAEGMWTSSSQWTLEEELKIGALEGEPEYQFGQIGFVDVDSKDRIFVMDAQAKEIRVFSPDGQYEQTIGRPGQGPGELGALAVTLYMGPGDTLLVPDIGNARFNRYAPDGTSLGSFRLALEQGLPLAINATRTGVIAEQLRPTPIPDQPVQDTMDVIVTLTTDGTILDTLRRFRSGGSIDAARQQTIVFATEPVWRLTDDMHLLFGLNDEYRFGVYGPDGSLERLVSKPFERTSITERDQTAMMSFFEELVQEMVPPAQVAEALARMRATVRFAEFYPAYNAILTGPEGTYWVQHVQSPSDLTDEELKGWNFIEEIGSPDWDVFDSEGRYLGVVQMPDRFGPRVIVRNRIYGVWRDEFDVQYAVRLRIIGPQGEDAGGVPLGEAAQ
jgi:hypothetical protein